MMLQPATNDTAETLRSTTAAATSIPEGNSRRSGSRLPLVSLAPSYDPRHHRRYVDVLNRVLDHPDTRAVAVTGPYGSGKSSVLRGLHGQRWLLGWRRTRRWPWLQRRVITTLSLSTLASEQHADSEAPDVDGGRLADDDLIQKELVKQLLYRLPTGRTPRSRFPRATKPSWRSTFKAAFTAAVLVGVGYLLALLTGWTQTVNDWAETANWQPHWVWLGVASILALGAGALWRHGAGRVELKGDVKASGLTVSLGPTAATYFDQYLDEIVYFFEVSRTNILVIEDLDRFGSTAVFDTLRALNTLVNSSRQVGRRVVFIYALRDSALDRPERRPDAHTATGATSPSQEAAASRLDRSNRAKYFDMIVPLVPFVTTDNARDVLVATMEGTDVSPALLRLAARHVADMRTIRSLRNEFELHNAELITFANPRRPGITPDIVFALVLLRATLPADFEAIRISASSLDKLRQDQKKLIEENVQTQTERLVRLRTLRENGASHNRLVAVAAERLDGVRGQLAALASHDVTRVEFGAPFKEDSKLADIDAWQLIAAGTSLEVTLRGHHQNRSSATTVIRLKPALLAHLIEMPLDVDTWPASDASNLDSEIAKCEETIKFLRYADWEELYQRSDLQLGDEKHDFAALVEKNVKSNLIIELIQHGYLPAEFASYYSPFYGRVVGTAASEFIHRAVSPGVPAIEARLDVTAIEQVLLEQDAEDDESDFFDELSVYNLDLVDYLLENRKAAAARVAKRIATRWAEPERTFVAAHFARQETSTQLARLMAPHWREALKYTAVDVDVTPATRRALVDTLLDSIVASEQSGLDDGVKRYLEDNYDALASVTTPPDERRAQVVMEVFEIAKAVIPDLGKLANEQALQAALNSGVYRITATNLRALGGGAAISLDTLLAERDNVFRHAALELDSYLDAIEQLDPPAAPIADPDAFPVVLSKTADVLAEAAIEWADEDSLDRLVTATDGRCRISDLDSVPRITWPVLARRDRFDVSVSNVTRYFEEIGADPDLASLLARHQEIATSTDDTDENRSGLAIELLHTWKDIGTPAHVVRLVASLEPGLIPASELQAGDGPLVPHMLATGVLNDDAEAFRPELFTDHDELMAAVRRSSALAEFADSHILPPAVLPDVLADSSISPKVRSGLVGRLGDLLEGADADEATRVATVFAHDDEGVGVEQLIALAEAGAVTASIVEVAAGLDEARLALDKRRDLLRQLGGQYAQIAEGGDGKTATLPDDESHAAVIEPLRGTTWKGRGRRKGEMREFDLISP